MSEHPKMDNVIYANFGRKTQVDEVTPAAVSTLGMSRAATWLLNAVNSKSDSGRISRGKSYARNGNVLGLEVQSGRIHANVAGSQNEPFHVTLQLPYRSTDDIAEIAAGLADTTNGLKKAQNGEVDRELLEILLTGPGEDIRCYCDCPDSAVACKHAVAVADIAATKMDADPMMVFRLRSLDLVQLEKAVAEAAALIGEESAYSSDERFWNGRELPDLPDPKTASALADSDLDALHRAMRLVSYTAVDQLRAVSDIEDMYDHLTR
ncbi:SWIM zinc finger family protein [Corynebacterium sp. A21]|uniref:SWIM zinc finger family protein n=1 Tax=Corynebacterium sp. A21 TaxID=3457318 RepID=UPI003FD0716E